MKKSSKIALTSTTIVAALALSVIAIPPVRAAVQQIFVNTTKVTDVQVGSTPVQQVYVGSTLVWERGSPTAPPTSPASSWIKSNTTVSGTSAANILVDLDDNMIPVINQADAGTTWADYDNRKWANAITVTPATLVAHKADPIGTVIPEADILGYWVYIPRYEYQVCRPLPATTPAESAAVSGCPTTFLTPYAFNINFQKSTQKTAYNGTTVGGWATHPAFTFDTTELNGIWVGKFEATGTAAAPTVKPNVTSLRNQNISDQFTSSQSIRAQHNLTSDKDTRMAKNSDWGAVAYLATSAYGRWGSAGGNEVYINNNNAYTTGCAGDTVSAAGAATCNDYDTTAGVHASTTDNVYGIYDMSGGAGEYVLANFNGGVGLATGPIPAAKYVNTYPASQFNGTAFTNYNLCTWTLCGGHALYETINAQSVSGNFNSWFSDLSRLATSANPWLSRGYNYPNTTAAGLFTEDYWKGDPYVGYGWRAVMSNQ